MTNVTVRLAVDFKAQSAARKILKYIGVAKACMRNGGGDALASV